MKEYETKAVPAEQPVELLVVRDHSPWRDFTGSPEEEAAGKRVEAVPDTSGLEISAHLSRHAAAAAPLIAIDRARRRVVVAATHFEELRRVDATRLQAGQAMTVGRVKSRTLLEQPRTLAVFLLESQLVETFWHIEAVVRLVGEERDGSVYRARFRGHHVYFTRGKHEEPLAFTIVLDTASGEMSVRGET